MRTIDNKNIYISKPNFGAGSLDIKIIKPKYIFLGNKDFQQSYLIKKHILKRKIKTKIINCKTIREKNGVACSTRNNNLSLNQFKIASKTIRYLHSSNKFTKSGCSYFEKCRTKVFGFIFYKKSNN